MNKKLREALEALDNPESERYSWKELREGWCWSVVQEELDKAREKDKIIARRMAEWEKKNRS